MGTTVEKTLLSFAKNPPILIKTLRYSKHPDFLNFGRSLILMAEVCDGAYFCITELWILTSGLEAVYHCCYVKTTVPVCKYAYKVLYITLILIHSIHAQRSATEEDEGARCFHNWLLSLRAPFAQWPIQPGAHRDSIRVISVIGATPRCGPSNRGPGEPSAPPERMPLSPSIGNGSTQSDHFKIHSLPRWDFRQNASYGFFLICNLFPFIGTIEDRRFSQLLLVWASRATRVSYVESRRVSMSFIETMYVDVGSKVASLTSRRWGSLVT